MQVTHKTPSSDPGLISSTQWDEAHTITPTILEGTLSANVVLVANQFGSGPSVTLTPGTWFLSGFVTVSSPNATAQRVTAKLWDTTNVEAASEAAAPSQGTSTAGYVNISLCGAVTVATNTAWLISVASTAASTIRATPGDNATGLTNLGSKLIAVKLA